MDTEERLTALEQRLAEYERLVDKLRRLALLSPTGRAIVKALGL